MSLAGAGRKSEGRLKERFRARLRDGGAAIGDKFPAEKTAFTGSVGSKHRLLEHVLHKKQGDKAGEAGNDRGGRPSGGNLL